jgi:hypothetical protein
VIVTAGVLALAGIAGTAFGALSGPVSSALTRRGDRLTFTDFPPPCFLILFLRRYRRRERIDGVGSYIENAIGSVLGFTLGFAIP